VFLDPDAHSGLGVKDRDAYMERIHASVVQSFSFHLYVGHSLNCVVRRNGVRRAWDPLLLVLAALFVPYSIRSVGEVAWHAPFEGDVSTEEALEERMVHG
jgi:hypothetical protein